MENPAFWLVAAMIVTPVIAIAIGLLAYGAWLDKKIEEEERQLPPAE